MPIRIVNTQPDMADQLERIQQACFPSLNPAELITAAHYRKHTEVFPEGQFVALNEKGKVVACSTDFRTTVDLEHIEHRYIDSVDDNWLGNHKPEGDWLYGADIGVHPDYRGQGISRLLYQARHRLVKRLNLKGHIAGGMLVGYGQHKNTMSVESYVEKLKTNELFDPTVSIQLKRGFKIHGIIQNYIDDPSCDNKAAFIIWRNPDYGRE